MSREEFYKRLGIVQDALDKVYKCFNTTEIPVHEYVLYLKDQIGLDIEKVEEK